MATLTEYFDAHAREVLARLDRGLQRLPQPDAAELQRAARELRGTAQMAREDRVFHTVAAFESVARALAANALSWSEDLADRARATISDLRVMIERGEGDAELDARAAAAIARWIDDGGPTGTADDAQTAPDDGSALGEFREFAAREVAAIGDALDAGVQQLAASPMDREPLKMILRRQRALLGAARLEEIPVVAEILRAVEDLTRVIAKLDVAVKQEWLDSYRVAREGLKGTIEALQRNEDPPPTHALSRLRHMREELLERYGTGEAVSAAHLTEGLVQATPLDAAPEPRQFPGADAADPEPVDDSGPDGAAASAETSADAEADAAAGAEAEPEIRPESGTEPLDVVPVEDLCYHGDAALARALELQDRVTRVAAHDPEAREAVDELFDLIRIARG
ncbi:MAG: hypothetical protein WD054_02100 [Gemmatimonadota bacterium]